MGLEPILVLWRTEICHTPIGIRTLARPAHTQYRLSYRGSKIQISQVSIMLNNSLAYFISTVSQELHIFRKVVHTQQATDTEKTLTFHRLSIAKFVITIQR